MNERWHTMSFYEQIGHIGSEIGRARHWHNRRNMEYRNSSLKRVLELIDLILQYEIRVGRVHEMKIFRDVIQDIINGTGLYDCSLESLERYCLPFGKLARKHV